MSLHDLTTRRFSVSRHLEQCRTTSQRSCKPIFLHQARWKQQTRIFNVILVTAIGSRTKPEIYFLPGRFG